MKRLLLLVLVSLVSTQINDCHYSCSTCWGPEYYECLTCPENRGQISTWEPISGMCYCSEETDEMETGECSDSNQFNYNNKAVIASLIGIALLITVLTTLISGMRYFLLKTIQDIQQVSIIVLINLYFPQQFDIFLTQLYRFNMSSYTLQALTDGNIFNINTNNQFISSSDSQNIFGKYKLLYKTANFLSNQFTWILIFLSLLVVGLIVHFIYLRLRACSQNQEKNKSIAVMQESQIDQQYNSKVSQAQQVVNKIDTQQNQTNIKVVPDTEPTKQQKGINENFCFRFFSKFNNILWLNFYITFFYLSLIQLNLNIFTQISHLTFSSPFAAAGAYFSALLMALQFAILVLLFLKVREQCLLPSWMRDITYTAPIYMIRTTYKTLTKYFWFFACLKKIMFALFLTVFYSEPINAIIAVSTLQGAYIALSMYLQPMERRYMRIHFYCMEAFKLLFFVGLINFTQKYVQYVRMIELTKIMYAILVFIFSFNLFYIVCAIIVEREVYYRYLRKLFCSSDEQNEYVKGKVGYHSQGKLYIYYRE